MRPAIDHEGRLWFGEMGHNFLTVFDPRTQTFQQMKPPRGAAGVMGVVVASDDTIWFAEQYADYIGHYFPVRKQFQVYNLPTLTVPDPNNPKNTLSLPSAPNDLALDAHGNVWFTELNADALGMLDVTTGVVRQYPLSSKKSVQVLNPYGVAIDPQGMVWFTESTTDSIGRLDPNTGNIRFYTLPGSVHPLMEIASDRHGTVWATSFSSGLLVRLDPRTETFTQYYAPASNNAGGLYGLLVTPTDEVWITNPAANVIAELDTASNHFIYYSIPTQSSLPLGLVMGADHTLWFTEAGSDKIGMLRP
jgi:streptogramin lyase